MRHGEGSDTGERWSIQQTRRAVLGPIYDLFPRVRHLFADTVHSVGKPLKALTKSGRWSIDIKRMADTVGFEVLPRGC